jgi:hypothetical protein
MEPSMQPTQISKRATTCQSRNRANPQEPRDLGEYQNKQLEMRESVEQQKAGIVALYVEWEVFHDETNDIQDRMEQPLAFVASNNPDVMYMDQAMKEPDSAQFQDDVAGSQGSYL